MHFQYLLLLFLTLVQGGLCQNVDLGQIAVPITITAYAEPGCKGKWATVNIPRGSNELVVFQRKPAASFHLSRSLLPQEQLDFSVVAGDLNTWTYGSPRNSCERFIRSYTTGNQGYGCQSLERFTCYRIWYNRGLGLTD
ncbi:hypothetical protein BJY00DRAFT_320089 [Aspergillus carlsbadensis]|nr:hypothetical protein BJY00DRAFT_320089 [Aspergillus carlsbadensis]